MQRDILTNRYDNGRAGVNSAEVELTPSAITTNTFGKLFSRTVDGDLYAQPLIVSDLWIEGAWRNVVYLATSRNWVYAYDADEQAAHVVALRLNVRLRRFEIITAVKNEIHSSWSLKLAA